jgi:hypothetical protein
VNGAGSAGERHSSIVVDRFDGPVVAVLDHHSAVGAQRPVVAGGHHVVTNQQPLSINVEAVCGGVEFTVTDPGLLHEPVETGDGVDGVGHQRHRFAPAASLESGWSPTSSEVATPTLVSLERGLQTGSSNGKPRERI